MHALDLVLDIEIYDSTYSVYARIHILRLHQDLDLLSVISHYSQPLQPSRDGGVDFPVLQALPQRERAWKCHSQRDLN